MKTILAQIRAEDYYYCKEEAEESVPTFIEEAIADSIVLGELTNGEVIQKMFPQMTVVEELTYAIVVKFYKDGFCLQFDLAWWNRTWGGVNSDCSTID